MRILQQRVVQEAVAGVGVGVGDKNIGEVAIVFIGLRRADYDGAGAGGEESSQREGGGGKLGDDGRN